MGIGTSDGENKAVEASSHSSPLLETSINGARGVLLNITTVRQFVSDKRPNL